MKTSPWRASARSRFCSPPTSASTRPTSSRRPSASSGTTGARAGPDASSTTGEPASNGSASDPNRADLATDLQENRSFFIPLPSSLTPVGAGLRHLVARIAAAQWGAGVQSRSCALYNRGKYIGVPYHREIGLTARHRRLALNQRNGACSKDGSGRTLEMFLSGALKAGRLFSRSRLVNLQHAGHEGSGPGV